MRWLDRINDSDRPARLDVFLRRYGDERTREIVGHGLRKWELDDRPPDLGVNLPSGSIGTPLPGLNRMSAPDYYSVRGE
jgi:hypothetical protein